MALRRALCVSMVVAATPATVAEDFIEGVYLQSEAGNSGSYFRCDGVALP